MLVRRLVSALLSPVLAAGIRDNKVFEIISGNAIGGRSIPPSQKMPCTVRVPTYNDYTVIGNLVMMCEGDDGKPLEPSTNCKELEKWLTK